MGSGEEALAYGARLHALGRELVRDGHVRLAEVVWDADEVLWDWLMEVRSMARGVPRLVRGWDLGHLEVLRVRPGMLELLAGMQEASRSLGQDPWVRIWTDGYPWRIWRIAQEVPELVGLLGPGPAPWPETPESFAVHPRLFARPDYADAVAPLACSRTLSGRLAAMGASSASVLLEGLRTRPSDSSLKLPELAALVGKEGFTASRILVDDRGRNTNRFVRSGRCAVHVPSVLPRWLDRVPNTVWSDARGVLARFAPRSAEAVAEGLRLLSLEPGAAQVSVPSGLLSPSFPGRVFGIDVPGARIREQWVEPRRRVRRAFGGAGRSTG